MNWLNFDEIGGNPIKKELLKIAKSQFGSGHFEVSIEPACKKGENFMGEVYRVLFNTTEENAKCGTKSLILKVAQKSEVCTKREKNRIMFLREIFMYEQIFPMFKDLQISKGIDPSEGGFNECPKCFSSISEDLHESLLLEDLKLRQFEVIDLRKEALTFEHVSLSMRALGKFHAMSFVLKHQHPEKLEQLKPQISGIFWNLMNTNRKNYIIFLSRFIKSCEEENRFDLSEKLKQILGDDPIARVFELVSAASAEPYSVLCHGDVTTNNSMFRKNDQGKAVEIQFLDFQFSQYASPVMDLVLYLLCSTTKELRDKHYDEFLKIYHESLSNLLLRMGSDPQKLLPFEALLDQFQRFGSYAIFAGMILMPILYANIADSIPGDQSGFTNDDPDLLLITGGSKKAYNKLVVDMLDDMSCFGYI